MKPLFILCGPSASGKTTVGEMLTDRMGLMRGIAHTTRPKRKGESDSVYHFVSDSEMKRTVLVESAVYAGYTYGISKVEFDKADFVIQEPRGVEKSKQRCRIAQRPCYVIGLAVTVKQQLSRMAQRGDKAVDIERRIQQDKTRFRDLDLLADVLVDTDDLNRTFSVIEQYIRDRR